MAEQSPNVVDEPKTYSGRPGVFENPAGATQIKVEELMADRYTKLDRRNVVIHNFTTTAEESFLHNLGRKPLGYIKINQSGAGSITGDKTKWTTQRIYLTSSVAPNQVTLLML
jgi:hypothetical protein